MIKKIIYRLVNKLLAIWQEEKYRVYYEKYKLPKSFRFNGEGILVYGDGMLEAGEESYIGSYSTLQIAKGCKISIGKKCRIAHNVRMYTRSLEGDTDLSKEEKIYKTGDIIIEDFAWIGVNVFINPGIRIGKNAIVGANTVLTKDVEPNSIVGGVPGKFIRFKNIHNG